MTQPKDTQICEYCGYVGGYYHEQSCEAPAGYEPPKITPTAIGPAECIKNCALPEGHTGDCVKSSGRFMCCDHEWLDEEPCPYCETRARTYPALEGDYLLGRCIPLLDILSRNKQAIELRKDIVDYANRLKEPKAIPAQEAKSGWIDYEHIIIELMDSLRTLSNEAYGFLSMADRQIHGNTNMAVLQMRIDNARALLATLTAPPEVKK